MERKGDREKMEMERNGNGNGIGRRTQYCSTTVRLRVAYSKSQIEINTFWLIPGNVLD